MKTIALLGPTASGKTSLSIALARECNAYILSLDSLSIYKDIDIASAKPTKTERGNIKHFGIDEILPNENFNVSIFFDIFQKAKNESLKKNKNLIIVGGTGFYLKSLLSGLSQKPEISKETKEEVNIIMQNLNNAFEILCKNDKNYAEKISSNDSYRIEKWLEIYLQSGVSASEYFEQNSQKPIINNIDLFEIEISKDILKDRISQRTKEMIKQGLIDEVVYLEKTYARTPKSMRSIGIKETLEYLDGFLNKQELESKIISNTTKLAKRQKTFNATQFEPHVKGNLKTIYESVKDILL